MAAARRAAVGSGGGGCESGSTSDAGGCRVLGLSSGGARADVELAALTDRILFSGVRNFNSCVTQSINGLYWVNQEYPRTAEVEGSNGVSRNQTQ